MNLFLLPIGSIIIYAGLAVVPLGWLDITGSIECKAEIQHFRDEHPDAGEFVDGDPLFCIKKVDPDGIS